MYSADGCNFQSSFHWGKATSLCIVPAGKYLSILFSLRLLGTMANKEDYRATFNPLFIEARLLGWNSQSKPDGFQSSFHWGGRVISRLTRREMPFNPLFIEALQCRGLQQRAGLIFQSSFHWGLFFEGGRMEVEKVNFQSSFHWGLGI